MHPGCCGTSHLTSSLSCSPSSVDSHTMWKSFSVSSVTALWRARLAWFQMMSWHEVWLVPGTLRLPSPSGSSSPNPLWPNGCMEAWPRSSNASGMLRVARWPCVPPFHCSQAQELGARPHRAMPDSSLLELAQQPGHGSPPRAPALHVEGMRPP